MNMNNDVFTTLLLLGFIFLVAAELPLGHSFSGRARLVPLILSLVCFGVDLLLVWVT